MSTQLAEEKYDAIAAAAQQDWEDRQLAEYRIESSYWEAVKPKVVVDAEAITLGHLAALRKANKLDRRLKRLEKRLTREQINWHELT